MQHSFGSSSHSLTEFSVKNVQVTLFRDYENMVGLDEQFFRDQFNRHLCVVWENLMEQGSYGSQMINDNNGNTQIGWQIP
jgi:hypothetical protein